MFTILFNICTISFLSYYDIGCTMEHIDGLLMSALGNITIDATKPFFLDSGSSRGGARACMGMVVIIV